MQEVEVNGVDAQSFKASFAGPRQLGPRCMVRIDFADNEHSFPLTCDGMADDFFGTAFAVHFRGIDEGHPKIDPELQGSHFRVPLIPSLAHMPGALAQSGNAFAGS